jgi:Glycosyl hydrolase family 9
LGLRRHAQSKWAPLRQATFSTFTALTYATLPGAATSEPARVAAARCLARSQLGYVLGDTGFSYVIGNGDKYPVHPHHRDAACTLAEDAVGRCQDAWCASKACCVLCCPPDWDVPCRAVLCCATL